MRVNRWLNCAALGAALMLFALPGFASEAVPMARDPELEKRVDAVSAELRCLVCQN